MNSLAAQFNLRHPDNPVVFFDISIGGLPAGRVKIELFADVVPKVRKLLFKSFNFRLQKISGNSAQESIASIINQWDIRIVNSIVLSRSS